LAATDATIEAAATALKNGNVIAFPTDTVYGVGANPFDENAIARLYAAKERPFSKAIPVLLATRNDIAQVARDVPPIAHELMAQHWPGALTLIVPRRADLPANLSPTDTIAVRVPDSATARAFIQAAGGAVAATSANRTGEPPAETAAMAMAALNGRITAVLDDGNVDNSAPPSTIIDCTQSPPRILRQGGVIINN
jgi:L-threonylcarbamoyladenylate synthase